MLDDERVSAFPSTSHIPQAEVMKPGPSLDVQELGGANGVPGRVHASSVARFFISTEYETAARHS